MAGTQTYGMREPVGRGRGARYTEGHVLRAKVIRQLRAQGLSLSAMNGSKAPGLRRVVDDIHRHYAGPVPRRQGASN